MPLTNHLDFKHSFTNKTHTITSLIDQSLMNYTYFHNLLNQDLKYFFKEWATNGIGPTEYQ